MTSAGLARELGTTDRTLRRLTATGVVKPHRRASGRKPLPAHEEEWLRSHWAILSKLRAALRSESRVRAAMLFGSVAKGTDTSSSDVDLILDLDTENQLVIRRLRRRLSEKLGRRVDVFLLSDLEAEPESLISILASARPVVDRSGVWSRLSQQRRLLLQRAQRRTAGRLRPS